MHLIALEQEPTTQRGGQELNLFELCQGLAQRGHAVTLLYERRGNLLEAYQQFCDRTIQVPQYGFDRRKPRDVASFLPSFARIAAIPVRSDSVVFSNAYHSIFYNFLLSKLRRIPSACYLQIPPFDFNRQRLLGLKGVDRFVAVSQQMKQVWANYGYDTRRIEVVLNGTDVERFQPAADQMAARSHWGIPEDARVISYVGRLDEHKGVEVLIRAFARVRQTGAKANLLIAGKPLLHMNPENFQECPEKQMEYQRSLQQLAVDCGVGDEVKFLGHIADTPKLFQASDITVLPSLWEEAFGRVITESMACGVPVVASRVGGIPEVLTGEFQEYLVQPGDEQVLAEALQRTLHWRVKQPELGDRCRQHVLKHFSIDRMVEGLEEVLVKVAAHE